MLATLISSTPPSDQLATDFDLRIDAAGPNFGNEVLLDALADSQTWPPS
jgi:hypothetical protein